MVDSGARPRCFTTDQLKCIYDYTKFHIGLYATLVAGLIGLMNFGPLVVFHLPTIRPLQILIGGFLLAGAFGAIVLVSLTDPTGENGFWDETKERLVTTPTWFLQKPLHFWLSCEHFCFWVAIVVALGWLSFGN